LDVVVLLLYPHHPHLPLDHCSLLGLDHLVQHILHDYLDQDLVQWSSIIWGCFLRLIT
jgi:hypothetical protein